MSTIEGDVTIELYPQAAPITSANFLRYVDEGLYDGASFYRTVRDDNQVQNTILIDVIQGGLSANPSLGGLPPIAHEPTSVSKLAHLDGTISLARGEPGTGSSEFFICIGAQPSLDFGGLRNPDGLGFAAFGRVVDGMDVVRRIHAAETIAPVGELEYTSGQMIRAPIVIESIRRRP